MDLEKCEYEIKFSLGIVVLCSSFIAFGSVPSWFFTGWLFVFFNTIWLTGIKILLPTHHKDRTKRRSLTWLKGCTNKFINYKIKVNYLHCVVVLFNWWVCKVFWSSEFLRRRSTKLYDLLNKQFVHSVCRRISFPPTFGGQPSKKLKYLCRQLL